jgi:phenylalanyl-tRNA synthetase beta chain
LSRQSAYSEVEAAVRSCAVAELQALELVDVFEGKGIPEGKRSLTLRLTFGLADRTLKDAEVNAAVEKILGALKAKLGAALRS